MACHRHSGKVSGHISGKSRDTKVPVPCQGYGLSGNTEVPVPLSYPLCNTLFCRPCSQGKHLRSSCQAVAIWSRFRTESRKDNDPRSWKECHAQDGNVHGVHPTGVGASRIRCRVLSLSEGPADCWNLRTATEMLHSPQHDSFRINSQLLRLPDGHPAQGGKAAATKFWQRIRTAISIPC